MSDVINPYLKSHQEKCLLQGTSNPKSEWDTKNDSEIKYFTMDFKNYTITKMNHLICPEDVNDVHVRKLLQLATFNDSELIDDYIMEYVGAIKDQYDVRLEIYGEKRLTEDNKYTILSLLKLSFEKVAIIFQKKELEDSVNSKLTHFELFGSLVLTHFTKAKRLASKIRKAVVNLLI
ncbi:uncharacterized protein LOC127291362 isoform X2 [Leptopilina boulardi]|uniref:uncharacterized protein LOC127291362 isoform X2 n=1 Tax=Leptopilina boulardi TaxID=63433 RepID=UPI0021F5DC05|nr:uncharacterized protein LOC127291362 isoform X2 [Leptopilina boulardi]